MEQVRRRAISVLDGLNSEDAAPSGEDFFWLDRRRSKRPLDTNASDSCRFFQRNGFLYIPNFVSRDECYRMKECMAELVKTNWNPNDEIDSFGTGKEQNTARGDYFLESSDKIHYFAEPCALEQEDETASTGKKSVRLRPEYKGNKITALNKAGHSLHMHYGVFREYALSTKVRDLVIELGWRDPVVPQSMYIFKQGRTGGAVHSHQDSTFLFTEPYQSCLGLWLALDDATLENGCLWVRPKSHLEAVRRQYKRNPLHFGTAAISARSNTAEGEASEQMFVMEGLYEHEITWDGNLPGTDESDVDTMKALLDAGFVPIECKAGDLLAFCGELDHLSLPNKSENARHTFQLHLVEGPNESVVWSESNWLQYEGGKPFQRLIGAELKS